MLSFLGSEQNELNTTFCHVFHHYSKSLKHTQQSFCVKTLLCTLFSSWKLGCDLSLKACCGRCCVCFCLPAAFAGKAQPQCSLALTQGTVDKKGIGGRDAGEERRRTEEEKVDTGEERHVNNINAQMDMMLACFRSCPACFMLP